MIDEPTFVDPAAEAEDRRRRSEARRAASSAARARQQRITLFVGGALAVALMALLAVGVGWGWKAASTAVRSGGGDAAGGSGGTKTQPASSGGGTPAAATSQAAEPAPTSIVAFSTSPRAFTPSTIGNPFGDYRFVPETKLRVYTRRTVDEVKIVAYPPAAYEGSGGATVPVTMVHKGPLKKGLQWIPWTGQTKEGYALPRGVYRLELEVLADKDDPRDVGRSVEATAELVSFVTIGNRETNLVALTVDDGWNADPRIFELLERENVPSTAFFIGGRGVADKNPELLRTAMDAGMEIANHSLDHAWLLKLTDKEVMRQATGGQTMIERVSGFNHNWFRPSGGAMDARTMAALYEAGFVPVQWSVDTEDTNGSRTTEDRVSITMGAVERLGSGTIILCHFGGHQTYDILAQVIPRVRELGYEFGTMSQVMAGTPGFTDEGPVPAMVTPDPPE